jgi:hypothetical protein
MSPNPAAANPLAPPPPSGAALERERARIYRSKGLLTQADQALSRYDRLNTEEYRQRRDAATDAYRVSRDKIEDTYRTDRDVVLDKRAEKEAGQKDKRLTLIETQLSNLHELQNANIGNLASIVGERDAQVLSEKATHHGRRAFKEAFVSGESILDTLSNPPPEYAKDPTTASIWKNAVIDSYTQDTGLTLRNYKSALDSMTSRIENVIGGEYVDEEAMLKATNEAIVKAVPDADGKTSTVVRVVPDKAGGYFLADGDVKMSETFPSVKELGQSYIDKINKNPFVEAINFIDHEQKQKLSAAAAIADRTEQRDFLEGVLKDNPQLWGDKQGVDTLLSYIGVDSGIDISSLTNKPALVNELSAVSPTETTAPAAVVGLQRVREDKKTAVERATAEAAEQAQIDTALEGITREEINSITDINTLRAITTSSTVPDNLKRIAQSQLFARSNKFASF